jgi:hypothetical protein
MGQNPLLGAERRASFQALTKLYIGFVGPSNTFRWSIYKVVKITFDLDRQIWYIKNVKKINKFLIRRLRCKVTFTTFNLVCLKKYCTRSQFGFVNLPKLLPKKKRENKFNSYIYIYRTDSFRSKLNQPDPTSSPNLYEKMLILSFDWLIFNVDLYIEIILYFYIINENTNNITRQLDIQFSNINIFSVKFTTDIE